MTREKLKEHCQEQVRHCEMWAKLNGEKPQGNIYEEHKLILELLNQEPSWILVSERPPDDETEVLVTVCIPGQKPVVRNGLYNNGYFFIDNGDTWEVTDTEVTAWMPSPTPYKAERED